MRNYVKRTAATPVDVINIMNPIGSPQGQRVSYPMPMRARAARIGYDIYHEDEKEETSGTTDRTTGVSTLLRKGRQNFTERRFFLGSRDQGRQDSPIRLNNCEVESRLRSERDASEASAMKFWPLELLLTTCPLVILPHISNYCIFTYQCYQCLPQEKMRK